VEFYYHHYQPIKTCCFRLIFLRLFLYDDASHEKVNAKVKNTEKNDNPPQRLPSFRHV
jgi:hypothetical protein